MNDDLPGASPVQRMVRPVAEARWYSVSNIGQAMLCRDEADARQNAAISKEAFPFHAPYSAVQLVDVAAVDAERERCIATLRALQDASGVNDDGRTWLRRLTRGDCVTALEALGPNVAMSGSTP